MEEIKLTDYIPESDDEELTGGKLPQDKTDDYSEKTEVSPSESESDKDSPEVDKVVSEEETTTKVNETDDSKNDKKKKRLWLLIAVIIGVLIFIGLTFAKSLGSKHNESEEIDYMQYVTGIQEELSLDLNTKNVDFMKDITWDKQYIQRVSCDSSLVDLTKTGEYEITYLIDVIAQDEEDIEKNVKVIVAAPGSAEKEISSNEKTDETNKSDPSNASGSNTSNNSSGQTSNSKPSGSSSSSNTNSGSGSSSSSTPSSSSKPSSGNSNSGSNSQPAHTHNWVAVTKTVNHPEEGHYENVCVQAAWDETVYGEMIPYMVCNTCGVEMYSAAEYEAHGEATGHWGFTDRYKNSVSTVHHDAVYEKKWVVDQAAWTETVTTGYKCSCGATK